MLIKIICLLMRLVMDTTHMSAIYVSVFYNNKNVPVWLGCLIKSPGLDSKLHG